MNVLSRASIALAMVAMSFPASAKRLPPLQLPPLQMTSQNVSPTCATPGRLMAFVHSRNAKIRPRFSNIAAVYMRHGEELGVRWDYAFFQMIVETGSLRFNGDVNWRQNNFAGLGATGGGVKGERFATVSDGVKAHLQHLMIYAGIHVANPVANRTRKVQSWRILDKWRRKIRGHITFADIGRKWAPVDSGYTRDIKATADRFYANFCKRPDINPGLQAKAHGTAPPTSPAGAARSSLGATGQHPQYLKSNTAIPQTTASRTFSPRRPLDSGIKVLNKTLPEKTPNSPTAKTPTQKTYRTASAPGAASKFKLPSRKPPQSASSRAGTQKQTQKTKIAKTKPSPKTPTPTSCRVWTASYGGQKAIIIRSTAKAVTNYTVLDVNKGRESREAAAYIAAYAKGGHKVGEFSSQTQALDRAFKLCPKG